MNSRLPLAGLLTGLALVACGGTDAPHDDHPEHPKPPDPVEAPKPAETAEAMPFKAGKAVDMLSEREKAHLSDLRQLTFGGENAEAYWSPDGTKLIFQRTPEEGGCDQELVFDLMTGDTTMVSSGKGRTTCGYYDWPKGEKFIYATTEAGGAECPPVPDHSKGYVWPLYASFDLVWHTPGQDPVPFLAHEGYDAEATACFTDGRLVFTSDRSGDLELWSVNPDGSDLKQLTNTPGYDGGAFYTQDCSRIVWRASRPEGEALEDYKGLLAEHMVRPSALEIYSMKADGTDVRQHTSNGKANFGPYPTPDMKQIIYSSNAGGNVREFDLWLAPMEGGGEPVQLTDHAGFDGFPMFSPDGKYLVFASNRATAEGKHDTNLFVARWTP
ncbi:MAG: PD40 domain-containing protein [Alphaproteobacteria bacterium]|nr:PD40 domain-containing protein [Alphaproteobacteria bacterium]